MNKMRIFHFVVLLLFLLAVSLQPVAGQSSEPDSKPVDSSPALDTPANAPGDSTITPLTISLGGGPDYDSGWVPIAKGQKLTLKHNLGKANTDYYWVDLDYLNAVSGINQSYYGGADTAEGQVGAYWTNLTTSTIAVTRRANDPYAEKVRVRIWTDPSQLSYNHWNGIEQGSTATFTSIAVDPDNYLVDLRFNDSNLYGYGINQRFYGGKDCAPGSADCQANAREGANWYSLSGQPNPHVSTFRQDEDTSMGQGTAGGTQYLFKVWSLPKPTYVSAWQAIPVNGTFTFPHSIGGNADDYLVDLEYKSSIPEIGVNQIYYGGARLGSNMPRTNPIDLGSPNDLVGAYWDNLTSSDITVHRNPQDKYADEVRVRIWDFWKPRPADYDSGWFNTPTGETLKNFDLSSKSGNKDNYLVDFQFKNSSGVIHQHNYGMNQDSQGNHIGAYWSNLENTSIKLVRAPQDTSVAQGRVRLWVMPKPDVDEVYTLNQGAHWVYQHNLGGSPNNYLVDLEFISTTLGTNQAGYGGYDTGTNYDQQVGVYWNKLDSRYIDVYRRPDDNNADFLVRLRMWRMAKPNYDSGLVYAGAGGTTTTLDHNLYQFPDTYFISTLFYNGDSQNGYNQAFFGGADLGIKDPQIANDKVGAYWQDLTTSHIKITKEPDDTYAGQVEVRIWVTRFYLYCPSIRKQ